ncbi:MAG: hypothetical protein ROZ09_11680 [Thiobacillus sp.]|jgi:hypothetical protein|uniref:phage tail tube protein n=1 Tax=Thiobacillus sp. TaxID=924 RepID=UPI002895D9D4|nr:hypothetical protein [Thiobacillus sp.]MDT3707480.1 hypothetical protein [Thiobacillus sp.]
MSNYTIPKGKIYFNDGTGEEYLGNTPGAELSVETNSLDHYSAESGIREKDDTALVEINRKLAITADDITVRNWSRFIIGNASTLTQASGAVVAESLGAVKQGRYYQIGASAGNPSGVRGISAVTVKVAAVAKTENVDYTVDLILGRLYIIPGGGIADASVVTVDYTKAANTRDQVISASAASVAGALRFVADNPKGANRDIFLPSVSLKPTGTAKLKGEQAEYMQLGFDVEILKKDLTTAAIYIDGRPV